MAMLRGVFCLVILMAPLSSMAACADIDCTCKVWGVTNPACKIPCEIGKAACFAGEKTRDEIGHALEDVRILVETGKCGGDLCDVLEATKNFGVDQVKDMGTSLQRAGKRLGEGKPLDAVWHLQMDYLNNSQENAAEAARRSALLQATGAIAAGAYGGPGGSAGYAAWLTYSQTKDLGLALKTGIITGAAAYASAALNAAPGNPSTVVAPGTPAAHVTASQIAARTVMGGVIAGVAVAAAGGKQEEIENAITRGAVAVLIREGYRELTSHELNRQNLKSSVDDAYCLKADPARHVGLSCLPPKEAYLRDGQGNILYEDGGKIVEGQDRVPKIDLQKLDQYRPHVGTWAQAFQGNRPFLGASESSGFMKFVSRIPGGWNAMAVAHDQFDVVTNPGTGTAIDLLYQMGTIAPFVVLTYEGAGGGVNDMIRTAAIGSTVGGAELPKAQAPAAVAVVPGMPHQQPPLTEITHVVCRKADSEKHFLLRIALSDEGGVDAFGRVCRIDDGVKDTAIPLWHAHFQRHTCIARMTRMIQRQLKQEFQCASSVGLYQADIKLSGKAGAPAPVSR